MTPPPSGDHGHGHNHRGHNHHGHGHNHGGSLRSRVRSLLRPHSHDTADSVDAAMEASAEGIRALKISLAVLGVTALAQLVVVALSGSTALLAARSTTSPTRARALGLAHENAHTRERHHLVLSPFHALRRAIPCRPVLRAAACVELLIPDRGFIAKCTVAGNPDARHRPVPGPGSGQVELAVDQCVPAICRIRQKDVDLTVLQSPGGAGVLPPHLCRARTGAPRPT